jgi:hypothetical protein
LEKLNTEIGTKQIAVRKKQKWDSSIMILSQSLSPKTWATLPAFHPLLIQLCPPNGLEVIKF